MFLFFSAFFAGVITVFAPCVFALLPVIIGGSMTGDVHDKRRPFIITASLAASLLLFTLLLKVTTLFINVSPAAITYVSGGIIVGIGLLMLFPQIYERLILLFNLQAKSQQLLGKGAGKGAVIGAIITGAALGPVFSSCSPVYGYILATVLPVNFTVAMIYMVAYIIGLSAMLLLIGFIGQKFVRHLRWASNPRGWFTRILAILFIVVGGLIMTGYDKQLQVYISEHTIFNFDALSSKLIPSGKQEVVDGNAYPAPEFTGLTNWINSEPLTVAGLKGKVVLVDFWTYSCINCIRTQPFLKALYANYKDSGFVIVGVHAPEFSFEKNPDNVRAAVKQDGLLYPIAQDNNLETWAAFQNQYWPASYLIDKDGRVRYTHFGEGGDKETETKVRALITENGGSVPAKTIAGAQVEKVASSANETPETYFGSSRAGGYVGSTDLTDGTHNFSLGAPDLGQWTLGGQWSVKGEGITAVSDSVLRFRVAAKDVYVVTGSDKTGTIDVKLDGSPISQTKSAGGDIVSSQLKVSMAQLYKLAHFDTFNSDATLELRVPAGVQLNTFTFGS